MNINEYQINRINIVCNRLIDLCDRINETFDIKRYSNYSNSFTCNDNGNTLEHTANLRLAKKKYDEIYWEEK